jgi:hypothetical protein
VLYEDGAGDTIPPWTLLLATRVLVRKRVAVDPWLMMVDPWLMMVDPWLMMMVVPWLMMVEPEPWAPVESWMEVEPCFPVEALLVEESWFAVEAELAEEALPVAETWLTVEVRLMVETLLMVVYRVRVEVRPVPLITVTFEVGPTMVVVRTELTPVPNGTRVLFPDTVLVTMTGIMEAVCPMTLVMMHPPGGQVVTVTHPLEVTVTLWPLMKLVTGVGQ